MNLSDGDRDWHRLFASFRENGAVSREWSTSPTMRSSSRPHSSAKASRSGWLNSTAYWLSTGALVPGVQEAVVTERACRLLHPANRPPRSAVVEVREWIAEEMRADVIAVDRMYPALQLSKLAGWA